MGNNPKQVKAKKAAAKAAAPKKTMAKLKKLANKTNKGTLNGVDPQAVTELEKIACKGLRKKTKKTNKTNKGTKMKKEVSALAKELEIRAAKLREEFNAAETKGAEGKAQWKECEARMQVIAAEGCDVEALLRKENPDADLFKGEKPAEADSDLADKIADTPDMIDHLLRDIFGSVAMDATYEETTNAPDALNTLDRLIRSMFGDALTDKVYAAKGKCGSNCNCKEVADEFECVCADASDVIHVSDGCLKATGLTADVSPKISGCITGVGGIAYATMTKGEWRKLLHKTGGKSLSCNCKGGE